MTVRASDIVVTIRMSINGRSDWRGGNKTFANTLAPPLTVATDNPHRHRLHVTTFVLMHHRISVYFLTGNGSAVGTCPPRDSRMDVITSACCLQPNEHIGKLQIAMLHTNIPLKDNNSLKIEPKI